MPDSQEELQLVDDCVLGMDVLHIPLFSDDFPETVADLEARVDLAYLAGELTDFEYEQGILFVGEVNKQDDPDGLVAQLLRFNTDDINGVILQLPDQDGQIADYPTETGGLAS